MSRVIQQDVTITIADSTTVSAAAAVPDGYDLVGIHAPVCTGTALTMTAAKTLTGTYGIVANAANATISHTISATAHYMALDPTLYRGLQFIKLVSGTVELANRTFTLVFAKRAT